MKRTVFVVALIISTAAVAADGKEPNPTQSYTIQLTEIEIQEINFALEITAHQCGLDADKACQIGLIGPSIRAKFIAAEKQAGK